MVAGDGDRLAIPQVDSVNRKRNLSEGKKKKTSGTCGKRVQIGRDIYEDMWEITFTQCKGVPIEGAYLCRNQCAWFAWKDCCCNYGEVGKGIVSFPNDQLLDVVTEDAETTEVVRITFIEGPFWVENPTNVERCWPQEISCVTAACPCGVLSIHVVVRNTTTPHQAEQSGLMHVLEKVVEKLHPKLK